MSDILGFFPSNISNLIIQNIGADLSELEEIRIRVNKPIICKLSEKEKILPYNISQEEILRILQILCDNSIYAYQNQICSGYITIKGGHRVGITGEVVIENEKVKNISYVYSLNFRIARQIEDASKELLNYILDYRTNSIYNTLIAGIPGTGKTTILRDLTKQISNGIPELNFRGITVGVVDERGEISAMYKGVVQNDLGIRTDVLNNIKKHIGIEMLVRSMAPKVIIADEIGNEYDIIAIKYAICSGVSGIFTAHGNSIEKLKDNPIFNKILDIKLFDKIIFLDERKKGKIDKVYDIKKAIFL